MRNLFACLVHEHQESVLDLVRNLTHLDPDSTILLYNGGADPGLLDRSFTVDGRPPLVHPTPRRQRWGRLHGFAIDCMRHGLAEIGFDALTIVDSDQLLLRPGYTAHLADVLAAHPRAGLVASTVATEPPTTRIAPAASAWRERDLWLPYCRRFPGGDAHFPHWIFWPATVFTAAACRDLVRAFDDDEHLTAVMRASRIFASEEIVLPTLVALFGHDLVRHPGSLDFVRYNVICTPAHLRAGMARDDVFWAHPIPRRYDHPLRQLVRAHHHEYHHHRPKGQAMAEPTNPAPLLLTVPLLDRMRRIDGWLSDTEADLLIAGLARALHQLPDAHAVVEIGSYLGRSTSVLGGVVKAAGADAARLYAIDPHDGELGALDQGIVRTRPTFAAFQANMAAAGLTDTVTTLRQRSCDVAWDRPISFLLIDGLHDYANVSADFCHFEPWLAPGGYAAFHDYADYYPGVRAFVDELLAAGRYQTVALAGSMILLHRLADPAGRAAPARPAPADPRPAPTPAVAPTPARPRSRSAKRAAAPSISCVMPTYDRPQLALAAVARFLRQDLPAAELVVVDDSPRSLAALLPEDPRVVYLRLAGRRTIGAKRNLGCQAARSPLLANWDDDDWYAPRRLRVQVAALADTGADVVGLDRLLYLEPAADRAWRYRWPRDGRPWVHDATLAFTRDFWDRNPFPDASHGIDCGLLWTASVKQVHAMADDRLYVGVIHAANTSPKPTAHRAWSPHSLDDVDELLGDDILRHLGRPAATGLRVPASTFPRGGETGALNQRLE